MLTPQQKYDQSEKGKARHRKHYYKNKEKYNVRYYAMKHNPKQMPCSIKGCKGKAERHHPDYKKPKEVIWLCRKHHMAVHGKIRGECKLCGKPNHARELCNNHYNVWLRNRDQ